MIDDIHIHVFEDLKNQGELATCKYAFRRHINNIFGWTSTPDVTHQQEV
jgi:hypothetical protein